MPTDNHKSNTGDILILGNLQTGKTTLFQRLTGQARNDVTVPTTSDTVTRGTLVVPRKGRWSRFLGSGALPRGEGGGGCGEPVSLIDTPGTASLLPHGEDEMVAAAALMLMEPRSVLLVADAKNLRRSLALFFIAAQFELPTLLALNMVDEARQKGLAVDVRRLSAELGVEVVQTNAALGLGAQDVVRRLSDPVVPPRRFRLPEGVEEALAGLTSLCEGHFSSPRGAGLLLLVRDPVAWRLARERLVPADVARAEGFVEDASASGGTPLDVLLTNVAHQEADRVVERVVARSLPSRREWEQFGRYSSHPVVGLVIAAAVLTLLYLFVGVLGATIVVDWLKESLFEALLLPFFDRVVAMLPWPLVAEAIMDRDFGLLPTGLFLAFGIVLPVLLFFYLAFAVLQDSGYLARLSVLLDRLFRIVGLNGKGVVPLAMGFSCVTMALITTRMLESKKERIIASLLLMLAVPCAPLLSVMLVILGAMPVSAVVTVFGLIGIQVLIAGVLASKLMPGRGTDFIMELPPMRLPRPLRVLRLTVRQSFLFMREAVPYFILATFGLFIFNKVGGLDLLKELSSPMMESVLGLPDVTVQVFIKTFVRRENGATELDHLRSQFDNLQLVVTLLVMTFMAPCVNSVLVLYKERGAAVATAVLVAISVYALAIGAAVNHFCRFFGVSFS